MIDLLSGPLSGRTRECPGDYCPLVFLDRSRPGARRWYTMEHCGNRHKLRALRVILDNLSAHKSEPVRDWLEHKKRRRWHLHFTPTSSSWLNLVETWFSVHTRKALTNASFNSVAELRTRIDWWVSHWNDNPTPFVWTKTADEIVDKVTRGRATLDRMTKSATHHQ